MPELGGENGLRRKDTIDLDATGAKAGVVDAAESEVAAADGSAVEGGLTEADVAPHGLADADINATTSSAFGQGPGASEVAWVIADLVPVLSEQTVSDLGRLLSRSLTSITTAQLREARLGLLIELVAESEGVIPGVDDYNAARKLRQGNEDETWPAHTTLIRTYGGHWLGAVRAAMRVAEDGASSRVATVPGKGKRPTYTRQEVAEAIAKCWNALKLDPEGRGPSANEFKEWAGLSRRAAQLAGQPEPRLPVQSVICAEFGTFDRAVVVARTLAMLQATSAF